jgi:outer membrane receptor protein involved in Fe transport
LFFSFFYFFFFRPFRRLKISGIVTDDKGAALPGVTVSVKGSTTATTTDVLGKFSIDVPGDNAVLQFTYVGMTMQEVSVSGKESIAISLVSTDAQNLNEVVVVGYGTQRKVTVTGAVSSVKGENLIKSPAVDLSNSLAGRLPGLVVIQTSGEPGYDGALVSIRGRNTLGNSSPLIVIDGIPDRDGGLGRLNPRDIESISVLKMLPVAIYGAGLGRCYSDYNKKTSGKLKLRMILTKLTTCQDTGNVKCI